MNKLVKFISFPVRMGSLPYRRMKLAPRLLLAAAFGVLAAFLGQYMQESFNLFASVGIVIGTMLGLFLFCWIGAQLEKSAV